MSSVKVNFEILKLSASLTNLTVSLDEKKRKKQSSISLRQSISLYAEL